jgi:hypothetical protein
MVITDMLDLTKEERATLKFLHDRGWGYAVNDGLMELYTPDRSKYYQYRGESEICTCLKTLNMFLKASD